MRMTSKSISFITTVLNEEQTIEQLLSSLLIQTHLPAEIIITDGGSSDKTKEVIESFFLKENEKIKNIRTVFREKKGNRSVGRNEAIRLATGDIIVCTDSGCVLDQHWIEEIIKPFENENVDVVAGYYKGKVENTFQKSQLPYVLIMEDRLDPKTFLPASRSMAFRKKIWEIFGGFPEKYSHNEDYVFAHSLRTSGATIVYAKSAVVYWLPRNNIRDVYIMFRRFAYGDIEAGIWRKKVFGVFGRYILGLLLLIFTIFMMQSSLFGLVVACLLLYIIWAISKNYRYVKRISALFYLSLLQFTADFAVLSGSLAAIINSWGTPRTR